MITSEEFVKATVQMREAEVKKVARLKEARAARREKRIGGWRWRIEPGMEESFRYLLGWLLPSRDGEAGGGASSKSKAA